MRTVQILRLNIATHVLWKPVQLLATRVIPIYYWRARDVVVIGRVCHIVMLNSLLSVKAGLCTLGIEKCNKVKKSTLMGFSSRLTKS